MPSRKRKIDVAMDFKSQLEAHERVARLTLDVIAERYRTEVLIPFCTKHALIFVSGNGVFCFFAKGPGVDPFRPSISRWEEAPRLHLREYVKVFDVLNSITFDRMQFGNSVGDVTEADWIKG